MRTNIRVFWLSPRTGRVEMAFGKDLEAEQVNSLFDRIRTYGEWTELRKFMEDHEGRKFSYILKNVEATSDSLELTLDISVH